jgi:hypothetical protein
MACERVDSALMRKVLSMCRMRPAVLRFHAALENVAKPWRVPWRVVVVLDTSLWRRGSEARNVRSAVSSQGSKRERGW